jgi:hypothetical protein
MSPQIGGYLLDIDQASHDYALCQVHTKQEVKVFVDQEPPLLLEKGYLSGIEEICNNNSAA